MAVMFKGGFVGFSHAGSVLLLLVVAAPLACPVKTSMILSIIVLELLVGLPCLVHYTGRVVSFIVNPLG